MVKANVYIRDTSFRVYINYLRAYIFLFARRYKFCGSLPNHLDDKGTLDDDGRDNNNIMSDTIGGNFSGTLPHKKRSLGVHFSDSGPTGTLDLVKHRSQDSLDENDPWRYVHVRKQFENYSNIAKYTRSVIPTTWRCKKQKKEKQKLRDRQRDAAPVCVGNNSQ